LQQVIGDHRVDRRHAGDVDHHDLGSVGTDREQEVIGHHQSPGGINDADDG
jgi:hypothetical protein